MSAASCVKVQPVKSIFMFFKSPIAKNAGMKISSAATLPEEFSAMSAPVVLVNVQRCGHPLVDDRLIRGGIDHFESRRTGQ
jgi:hypothetical protein